MGEGFILGQSRISLESFNPFPLSKTAFLLFVTLSILTNASAFTGTDFNWKGPVDVETTEFPKDICSADGDSTGEDFIFQVDLEAENLDGSLYLESKSTDSKSWTNQYDVFVKPEYGVKNEYSVNINHKFSVSDSSSNTVTIDGNEHTFEVGFIDSSSGFTDFKVDGIDYSNEFNDVGDYATNVVEGRPVKITENTGTSIEVTVYDPVRIPEGKTDYRWRYAPNSGTDKVSVPFYANCDSERVPAPSSVTTDSLEVGPFSPYDFTSGVSPKSSIVLNLSQKDNDNYNVTLYNGGDTPIGKIVRDGDLLRSGYVLDTVADTFSWQESTDTLVFSPIEGFMDDEGSKDTFYFEIVDNFGTTRYTPEYRVELSGTNDPPVIDSFEAYDGSVWKPVNETSFGSGQVEQVRVSVTDSNNDRHNAYLNLTNEYDQYVKVDDNYYTNQDSGTTYVWNLSQIENSDILDSGEWTAEVFVSDGADNTTELRTWSYPFNEPDISANYSQTDVNQDNTFEASAVVSCSQYECINENESISTYLDPVKISKEPALFSLKYWRSWIKEVIL